MQLSNFRVNDLLHLRADRRRRQAGEDFRVGLKASNQAFSPGHAATEVKTPTRRTMTESALPNAAKVAAQSRFISRILDAERCGRVVTPWLTKH